MFTAEELRLHRRRRRRVATVVLVLLLLLVLGFIAARPTRHAIKGWQARRHAQKAFALIEQESWLDARNEAVAAFQLRSTEPQALRAIARLLSRTRQAQALEFWDQLRKLEPLTHEDLRDEAAAALGAGETARAQAAVDQLLDTNPAPRDWLLAAQVALARNAPEDAQRFLDKIFAAPAATEREQFQATLLRLTSGGGAPAAVDRQTEAWARLKKIASGTSPIALDALVVLAQQLMTSRGGLGSVPSNADSSVPSSSPADGSTAPPSAPAGMTAEELARALEAHPLAKAPQKLLALDLRIVADPTQRDALIERAIAEWKNSDAASEAALATWLNGKGQYQKTLDTIPLETALQTRELFLQHVDALGALGRWTEIKSILEAERFPLNPVIQRMYLARTNAQLGEKTASENNWQRALEAAGNDVGKLMTLAEYAEKNGALNIAAIGYTQVAAAAPKLRPAQQGRLRAAQAAKETKRMQTILGEMLQLWPNDTSIQNDEAYMRLLLLPMTEPASPELNAIERLAEDLVKREPASLPHRTLLALARLKQNRPAEALRVYADLQIPPGALTPSALAVHAAVLSANGKKDEAREEISHIPGDQLLVEEQAGTANLRD